MRVMIFFSFPINGSVIKVAPKQLIQIDIRKTKRFLSEQKKVFDNLESYVGTTQFYTSSLVLI